MKLEMKYKQKLENHKYVEKKQHATEEYWVH